MPVRNEELPSTIERSPEKVRRTYEEALENAHREYGSEEQAHRVAWAAVKHVAEKVGDHWELKDRRGPSDPRAEQPRPQNRRKPAPSYGGVNVNQPRSALEAQARELGIRGRSRMNKQELAQALKRASERLSARARRRSR